MINENTFTITELDALQEAFSDRIWGSSSLEPDARVDVLFDPNNGDVDHDTPFLVRAGNGWAWTNGPGKTMSEPRTWDGIVHFLRTAGHHLRIPTMQELLDGGWSIETSPPRDEEEETLPLATSALLNARDLLKREDGARLSQSDIAEANALALTSIAATLHDLSVLLDDEFAWRHSQRPDPSATEESDEDDSAHRSMGPGEDPGFSFSGR